MDDRRFDDLARAIATSRRGALKTVAGIAGGGLLALLDRAGGDAQRRPRRPRPPRPPRRSRNRPGICNGRRDFARCGGECGRCLGGQCIPDHASCFACDFCDADTLMCIPIAEGQTCGNSGCSTCQGGSCLPAHEGEECGECGVCRGGQCRGDEGSCGDPDCQGCDAATGLCVLLADGTACGGGACGVCEGGRCVAADEGAACGDCGVCQGGACVDEGCGECGVCAGGECRLPDDDRCGGDCALCIQTGRNFTCIQAEDISDCGNCGVCVGGACINEGLCGECGRCESGTCVPDQSKCDPDCEICDDASLTCDPTITEGLRCGLDCGVCRDGTCMAETAECPDPACQICDPETRACEARPDFTVCRGECAVCQGGSCVAGGCEEPECSACNAATGTCDAINEGLSCGDCGVCQGGVCAGQRDCGECGECVGGECVANDEGCEECQVCNGLFACDPAPTGTPCSVGTCRFPGICCPPETQQCSTTCCDLNAPACEFCQLIADPSAPNGLRGECGSVVASITEICASNGVGVFFPPDAPCGACCAQSGTPCQRGANARYRCCSGGTCDVTTDFICP